MKKTTKKVLSLLGGLSILVSGGVLQSKAVEWDVDVYGVSYHLIGSEANPNAPRDMGIGDPGQTVFNPGIGIGIDFRDDVNENGFSFQGKAGYLRDCADEPLYYGGAGVRYRHVFKTNISFDVDALLIAGYGQDWETGEYSTAILPYVTFGIGYVFNAFGGDKIAKLNIAYVPADDTISATSGTDLLFFSLTFGF